VPTPPHTPNRRRARQILGIAIVALVLPLGWQGVMAGRTSEVDFANARRYALPWASGETHVCVQGNDTFATHRGERYRYAWDFLMQPGTIVHAARSGIVRDVEANHGQWPGLHVGNQITIVHEDGTMAVYGHLNGDRMRVRPGQSVRRGQAIGGAGLSGRTLYPHLHFHVLDADGRGLPVAFLDIPPPGIPHVWGAYRATLGERANPVERSDISHARHHEE